MQRSIATYRDKPVGTVAARDPEQKAVNYDQIFTRDFVVSAAAFLLKGEPEIVRQFLKRTLELQSREKNMDCYTPAQGLIPASFVVRTNERGEETLEADFGNKAIGRVAPMDAPFWWLYLLRFYTKATGDAELARLPRFQNGIRLILGQALPPRFDMFPTLLVPDGSFMIDRRLGVYGHPLEIQALFFAGLRSALELLTNTEENRPYIEAARRRARQLREHIRCYYWVDLNQLTTLNRAPMDDYGEGSGNRFNINPNAIPPWVIDWLTEEGGYFAGNVGPGRMDHRFFSGGNLLAVLTSLAAQHQAESLVSLMEYRQNDLVAKMPLKAVFPALTGKGWELLTGSDLRNSPWSYQNGGGWPFLLWLLAAAATQTGHREFAKETLAVAETRLNADQWPEYYDGRNSRLIGKEARLYQTWSIAGYLTASLLMQKPQYVTWFRFLEEID